MPRKVVRSPQRLAAQSRKRSGNVLILEEEDNSGVSGFELRNEVAAKTEGVFQAGYGPKTAMTLEKAQEMVAAAQAARAAEDAAKKLGEDNALAAKLAGMTEGQRSSALMTAALMKRKVIILEDNPDIPPTGLFIGYNGNAYVLKVGVEALVPLPLCEILDNARTNTAIIDRDTSRILGYRSKLRFPYRVMREAA